MNPTKEKEGWLEGWEKKQVSRRECFNKAKGL